MSRIFGFLVTILFRFEWNVFEKISGICKRNPFCVYLLYQRIILMAHGVTNSSLLYTYNNVCCILVYLLNSDLQFIQLPKGSLSNKQSPTLQPTHQTNNNGKQFFGRQNKTKKNARIKIGKKMSRKKARIKTTKWKEKTTNQMKDFLRKYLFFCHNFGCRGYFPILLFYLLSPHSVIKANLITIILLSLSCIFA